MSFVIKGKVVDESTGAGAPGVRVEAWDADQVSDDFAGWAVTDADGSFAIEFNELLTAELYDVWPDLYFRVYQSGVLLLDTYNSILWNVQDPAIEVTLTIPICPTQPPCVTRDIYLKIERIPDYSTVRPTTEKLPPHIQYGRDCMRFEGHEDATIPEAEIAARSLTAVVYREYLDSGYLVPKPDKLILADINEPPYHHRVPGTVIYTRACERLRIHVWNTDDVPHSLHVHGLRYGIDSDASWPFGVTNHHHVRSDAICPGETYKYLFDVTEKMRGPWPFHDHTHHHASRIERGLIGGIVVLAPWERPPRCFRYPVLVLEELYNGVLVREKLDLKVALPEHLLATDHVHEEPVPAEGGVQPAGAPTHTHDDGGHTHEGGVHAHAHDKDKGGGHEHGAGHAHHEAEGAGHGHTHEPAGGQQPAAGGGAVTTQATAQLSQEELAPVVEPVETAVELPRAVRADRLGAAAASYLEGQVHFLEELAVREILYLERCRLHTDHCPVFFHVLASGESNPVFDSGDLEEFTGVFEFTFGPAGDYDYFCQHHPIMTGTVHVVPGGPPNVTVHIVDVPAMSFSPQDVTVDTGGTVRWENHSMHHHTVTSTEGAALATHCINGRGFVGNTPTIVGPSGQRIRFYVFNVDTSINWHNFHPHGLRWTFAGENIDIRSMGPAESFTVDAEIPPVIILEGEAAAAQDPACRPKDAKAYRVKGDFVFHCHVHHHMMNGMVALVRARQTVWLTDEMLAELEHRMMLPLDDGSNACPEVDPHPCMHHGGGHWEEVEGNPEVTFMHSVLLPGTDKVLFWGYTRADQSRLWDYSTPAGAYSLPANQPATLPGMNEFTSDLWSAAHTLLDTPEGLVLAHGGFSPNRCFTFNPATLTWAQVQDTVHNRFYATTLTQPDATVLTIFGPGVDEHEIYTHGVGWTPPAPFPASMFHHEFYPWTYVLPDGRLFIAGPHVPTQRFDLAGLPGGVEDYATNAGDRSTGGEKGTSVLQILRPPDYKPIAVIMAGDPLPAQQTAEQIDLSAATPAWNYTPTGLAQARAEQCTATLLPDGRIFLAGGISGGTDGGPCEIFDPLNPAAGWQPGPNMTYVRTYHSSFILLRDGSVLGGGDPGGMMGPTPHERFFPDYFDVTRPTITGAPASVAYGASFNVTTPDSISEVVLLRPGAVTHGYNMSQRGIELVITGAGGGTVTVQAPPSANHQPPGWHLLFVLNGSRVPSEGRWIRLTP